MPFGEKSEEEIKTIKSDFDEVVALISPSKESSFEKSIEDISEQIKSHSKEFSHLSHFFYSDEYYQWFIEYNKFRTFNPNADLHSSCFFRYIRSGKFFTFPKEYNFLDPENRKKNIEEQKVFNTLLDEFCSSMDQNKEKLLTLDIKDSKDKILKGLLTFSFSDDLPGGELRNHPNSELNFNNFKIWLKKKVESCVFLDKEKVFGIDLNELKKQQEEKETEERKDLRSLKSYFTAYQRYHLMDSDDSLGEIFSDYFPYKTTEENQALLDKLIALFETHQYLDSIPPNQLAEIQDEFKDSFIAHSMETFDNRIDKKSSDLRKDYKEIWNNNRYKSAVNTYTSSSEDINSFLRGKHNSKSEETIPLVETFFNQDAIAKENIVTIRGSSTDKWLKNKLAGDYVVEPGCLSTSLSWSKISSFSGRTGIYYIIYIPSGSRGIYIQEVSNYSDEKEFLLPPGCVFKIISIENRSKTDKTNIVSRGGLVYSLLLVGTITTSVLDSALPSDSEWQELKSKISPQ